MPPPKPGPNYDGNAKERVPTDQQARRDNAPQDENDQSAIRQVRRQHRGYGGIHKSEQFRTNSVIVRHGLGKSSENGPQAGGCILARGQDVLLLTRCLLPGHWPNPVY